MTRLQIAYSVSMIAKYQQAASALDIFILYYASLTEIDNCVSVYKYMYVKRLTIQILVLLFSIE